MSSLWFQIFTVFHFLKSSFSFLPYLVAFIVSFCSCFFFSSLLSPYSPALARQTSSLTFFLSFLCYFFSPMYVVFFSSFSFFLFCLSFTQYFEYLSPYDTFFYNCLTPRANSGGGDSRQWQKSDLSAALVPIIASPLKKNSCYYPPYMFPKSVSPFTILSFICVKYFPIVVMYFS